MRLKVVLAAVLVGALSIGMGACKSKEEKVCAHVADLASELPAEEAEEYSEAECLEEIGEIKEECSNVDEVLDCLLEKDNIEDLRDCQRICEEAE